MWMLKKARGTGRPGVRLLSCSGNRPWILATETMAEFGYLWHQSCFIILVLLIIHIQLSNFVIPHHPSCHQDHPVRCHPPAYHNLKIKYMTKNTRRQNPNSVPRISTKMDVRIVSFAPRNGWILRKQKS